MKMNLTKAAIDALPFPESGKSFYYDTKLQGFGLYTTKTGKMYFAEGRVKGNPKKIRTTIGKHGPWMPDKARDEAKAILVKMDQGENPNQRTTEGRTLKKAVEEYVRERSTSTGKTIKQKTIDGYLWLLQTPLKDWQDKSVGDMSPDLVKSIHKKITEKSGPTCANNCLRLIRATFRYLDIDTSGIQVLSQKKLWNPDKRRSRFIESEKVSGWIKAAENLDIVQRGLVLMMLFTGLRRNEVLTLKRDQIRKGCVYLEDTKNGDEHMVPMGPYLQARIEPLLKLKEEGDWLFPSRKAKSGHVEDPRKAIASLGLKVSAHDLRRTFVSHLNAMEPAPSAYTIKRLMNHRQSQSDVTEGYIQIEEKKLRGVITQLEHWMLGTS